MIPPQDLNLLRPYLMPGERLAWAGRPRRGIYLRLADLALLPLSLVWGAAAFSLALPGGWVDGLSFEAGAVAALLFGVYLVGGRFLHEAWLRRRLVYGVTDRRILILRTGRWPSLRSLEIQWLPVFEYEEHRDGRGTLRFDLGDEEGEPWHLRHRHGIWVQLLSTMRFDRIEQPRHVYDLIRRQADRLLAERRLDPSDPRAFIG
jgi:hypothetical protein